MNVFAFIEFMTTAEAQGAQGAQVCRQVNILCLPFILTTRNS